MRTPRDKLLQRTPNAHYTPEQIEYIYEAAANGLPMQTITKKLKTTHASVRYAFIRRRLSIRHVRDTYTLTANQLRHHLGLAYVTMVDMAAACGLTKQTARRSYHWLNIDQITCLLRDQRFWWRWQPQRITLDWLRDLATEIRSQPVNGAWLPIRDAANHYRTSTRSLIRHASAGIVPAQYLGNRWLIWCPTEK